MALASACWARAADRRPIAWRAAAGRALRAAQAAGRHDGPDRCMGVGAGRGGVQGAAALLICSAARKAAGSRAAGLRAAAGRAWRSARPINANYKLLRHKPMPATSRCQLQLVDRWPPEPAATPPACRPVTLVLAWRRIFIEFIFEYRPVLSVALDRVVENQMPPTSAAEEVTRCQTTASQTTASQPRPARHAQFPCARPDHDRAGHDEAGHNGAASVPVGGGAPQGLSWSWELDFETLVAALNEPAPWNRPPRRPWSAAVRRVPQTRAVPTRAPQPPVPPVSGTPVSGTPVPSRAYPGVRYPGVRHPGVRYPGVRHRGLG